MSATRMEQINELLRLRFAETLEREVELPRGVIVTCKRVVTSRDFSGAKVWLSVLPADQAQGVLRQLIVDLPRLQRVVASKVHLQFMPALRLMLDESEQRAQRVTDLLDHLHDEPTS